jgi:uncharacterized DUF497 family protein
VPSPVARRRRELPVDRLPTIVWPSIPFRPHPVSRKLATREVRVGSEEGEANVEKHGVTFEEASTAFADWDSITVADPKHSIGEERWYLLGVSETGKLLVVCHTERDESFRIFSAWHANKRQRKQYEEQFEETR